MTPRHFLKCLAATIAITAATSAYAEKLVILHTNDTHSQIDPDDSDNLGGVGRRKVVIDSVRAVNDNVMLIDAGDVVQGTLYFNLYGGKVEELAMNAMGYDIQILGNHEFDNGVDALSDILSIVNADLLATNYDLSDSPLNDMFEKFTIKEIDGKRIGFIAINLEPKGMIAEGNYDGVEYLDAVESANASAWWLKNIEHCDLVIAITHIGYQPVTPPGDLMLARQSDNIDIIIGGHSHDLITPGNEKYEYRVTNSSGKPVLVTQVGKSGKNVGEITIDLDSLTSDYRVIPINSRLDALVSQEMKDLIAPYRAGVDSLMTRVPVAKTKHALAQNSVELLNWATDVVLELGRGLAPDVDFAILNKGGLRRGLPKGTVNEGQLITMIPFNNRIQVIDIKGSDLLKAFEAMARVDGNGVSDGVEITFVPGTDEAKKQDARLIEAKLNGTPIDPDRTYRVATIDYLAGGGDYMPSLRNHTPVAQSSQVLYNDVLDYLRTGAGRKKIINPASTMRMRPIE